LNLQCNAFARELLVCGPDVDVGRISFLKICHQCFGSGRTDIVKRPSSRAKVRFEPAGQPDVGNARGVVRVEMGQEQCVDSTDRYADLEQPDGRPSPRIDQQFLLAGLDEGAWPENAAWVRPCRAV